MATPFLGVVLCLLVVSNLHAQSLGRTFTKLRAHDPLNIVFIGGSITAGDGASDPGVTSYSGLVSTWFENTYPNSKFTITNAAIPGTGSQYGAFRTQQDVLSNNPDLVFVEFAVNDSNQILANGLPDDANILRQMEGIVRQIYTYNPQAEIVFVYTCNETMAAAYKAGSTPDTVLDHEEIGNGYSLVQTNPGQLLEQTIANSNGAYVWQSGDGEGSGTPLTVDGVHPNDAGYQIYANAIISTLTSHENDTAEPPMTSFPTGLSTNPIASGQEIPASSLTVPSGWAVQTAPFYFPEPYYLYSDTVGETYTYTFTGTDVGIMVLWNAAGANLDYSLDGAAFTPTWTMSDGAGTASRVNTIFFGQNMTNTTHTLILKIEAAGGNATGTTMYLGSILAFSPSQALAGGLAMDYQASNYTVSTGVAGSWANASSLTSDTSVPSQYWLSPGLSMDVTPSGSSAVNFSYNGYQGVSAGSYSTAMNLGAPLTAASYTSSPNLTISVVAKMPSGYATSDFFGGTASGNLSYRINANGTQTLTAAASADVATSTGTAYTAGSWAVFTVTYGSGSYAFYLNGVQVGSGTSTTKFTVPTVSQIAATYGVSSSFDGDIADIQIYNTALTSTQVTTLYNTLYNAYLANGPALVDDYQGNNYTVATNVAGSWKNAAGLTSNTASPILSSESPGLDTYDTPSGSSAVDFSYDGYQGKSAGGFPTTMSLASPLTAANYTTSPNFTMSVVAKIPSGYSVSDFFGGTASGNLSYRINANGTQTLTAAAYNDVGTSTGAAYTAGSWAVFTVTYGSGSYAFYLNGVQVGSGTSTTTFTVPTASEIAATFGVNNAFQGQIADLQIYGAAMSATQVANLYNAQYNSYIAPFATPVIDYQAGNYTVIKGTAGSWANASGLTSNTATPIDYWLSPGLTTDGTPSGDSLVNFNYNGYQGGAAGGYSMTMGLGTALTAANYTSSPNFTISVVAMMPSGYATSDFLGGTAFGNLSFRINSNGTETLTAAASADVATSGGTYAPGSWGVFTVTYGSGSYAFYLNGVQVGSGTSSTTFTVPTVSAIAASYGVSSPFAGNIADIQIYNTALTPSQVTTLYGSQYNAYVK